MTSSPARARCSSASSPGSPTRSARAATRAPWRRRSSGTWRRKGVASREDLAGALGIEPDSERLQEALERALGSGRAEWYGPGLYGVPRGQLEELASEEAAAETGDTEATGGVRGGLDAAVSSLEGSLTSLGTALSDTTATEPAGPEQIRELRRLADDGVISEREFELKKREILDRI